MNARTNPDTPRSEGGADPVVECFACCPSPLSMPHAKLSSHKAALCEEPCKTVRTQTDASLGPQGAIRYTRTTTTEQRYHTRQDVHVTRRV
ncbi:hypothetical protein Ahy_A05g022927 isoform B [Arachis hypogaea]|uniref:Uncharacterized protein n=1 Tax=Arachis hypogaea TaxID=3818 RepID=A0A445D1Z8_ARAHY|nr:hypothetical protein Ahy_A05g022927 isoform B [Arachis hypogaea]